MLEEFFEAGVERPSSKVDRKTMGNFLVNFEDIAGDNYVDDALENDFSRMVCLRKNSETGEMETVPVEEVIGCKLSDFELPSKKLRLGTEEKEEERLSEKEQEQVNALYDLVSLGNVYLYDRGADMPRRYTLDDKSSPHLDSSFTKVEKPSLLKYIANFITGGRAYASEIREYDAAKKDLEIKGYFEKIRPKRAEAAQGEKERYAEEQRRRSVEASVNKVINEATKEIHAQERGMERLEALGGTKCKPLDTGYEVKDTADYQIPEGCPLNEHQAEMLVYAAAFSDEACLAGCMEGDSPTEMDLIKIANSTLVLENIIMDNSIDLRPNVVAAGNMIRVGRQQAAEAMEQYAKGNAEPAGKLLGQAIQENLRTLRVCERCSDNYMFSAESCNEFFKLLESDPALMKASGVTEEERKLVNGAMMIRDARLKEAAAKQELAMAAKNGYDLSQEELQECLTDIVLGEIMDVTIYRHNQQYGSIKPMEEFVEKAKAAGVYPENKLDQMFYRNKAFPTVKLQEILGKRPEQMEDLRELLKNSPELQKWKGMSPEQLVVGVKEGLKPMANKVYDQVSKDVLEQKKAAVKQQDVPQAQQDAPQKEQESLQKQSGGMGKK